MTVITPGAGDGSAALSLSVPLSASLPDPQPVSGPDPAELAAAVDALSALSARLRDVAALVGEQMLLQRSLLDLDWHGQASSLFTDVVGALVGDLADLVRLLEQTADAAVRRAGSLEGPGW